jgi:hypothetical protein
MTEHEEQREFHRFLIDKLGGAEQVLAEFISRKVAATELDPERITVGQLCEMAREQGWLAQLEALSLSELEAIFSGRPAKPLAAPSASRGERKRMTKVEMEEAKQQMLDFLRSNPWSSAARIGDAIGLDSKVTGRVARKLREAGEVQTQGEKRATRYALASESKPAG